jgi:hypothetical protein
MIAVVDQRIGASQLCFESKSGQICPPMGIVNQPGLCENEITRVEIANVGSTRGPGRI